MTKTHNPHHPARPARTRSRGRGAAARGRLGRKRPPGDLWPSARTGPARQPDGRNNARGGTDMRVVIVYESMCGITQLIADAIAKGLGPGNRVNVVPVAQADRDLLDGADLVVAGGPTHVHGMSRARSRASAVEMAHKDGNHLTLDPSADGPGLRDWLAGPGPSTAPPRGSALRPRDGGLGRGPGARAKAHRQAAGAPRARSPRPRRELPGHQGQPVAARRAIPGRAMGRGTGGHAARSPAGR